MLAEPEMLNKMHSTQVLLCKFILIINVHKTKAPGPPWAGSVLAPLSTLSFLCRLSHFVPLGSNALRTAHLEPLLSSLQTPEPESPRQ